MPDLSQRLTAALADRYRIERELGRGGMATVFLAEDLKHHRRVAIKVLDPQIASTIGSQRFLREIDTVARLTHPHILPLFDSGIAGGSFFYVMPYVEGESLRERLKRDKQLPVADALLITREIADALGFAHARGVVHRDIKPENILIEESHAVLADFGIAHAIAPEPEELTWTGLAVGTPGYMSPEQAAGRSRDVDSRSDLYSLACVLYEMLAGEPPFTGPTAESLSHQHMNVAPRPVTELRPAVPAAVGAALQRSLAKVPADRFDTVAQFCEALGEPGGGAAEPRDTGPPGASRPRGRRGLAGPAIALGAVVLAVGIVAGVLWVSHGRPPVVPGHDRAELAVLPFQNLGAAGADASFAGGLHEELLTQLAKVAALKVISRTSVMGYAVGSKPLKQIAGELGVGSIVEGSVQILGRRLRVNVQLIDAATDEHLWAEHYDRTLDDAFAIQSEVAQRIVAGVGARLASAERQAITETPTASPDAYQLYLQGEDHRRRPGSLLANLESARKLYERALAIDPGFALAHAALAEVHGRILFVESPPSPDHAERVLAEARAALRLAPHLPESHIAMGMAHYRLHQDYRGALDEFRTALRSMPNNGELWAFVGYAQRRLGNWSAADSAYQRAIQLDPRNVDALADLGGHTLSFTHRYAEAVRAYDRALVLDPDNVGCRIERAWALLLWKGDLGPLKEALGSMAPDEDLGGGSGHAEAWRAQLLLMERAPDSLLAFTRTIPGGLLAGQNLVQPAALYAAWSCALRHDAPGARAAFASALRTMDSLGTVFPGDWRVHAARGLALAGLGRRAEAVGEARWLQDSPIHRHDSLTGPILSEHRALIFAQLGEGDAALEEIERLLRDPSRVTIQMLRLDPRWDPIRAHPRFRVLVARGGPGGA